MTYAGTDENGKELLINNATGLGKFWLTLSYKDCQISADIRNEDAPRVALEILKAAGVDPSAEERAWGDAVAGTAAQLSDIADDLETYLSAQEQKRAEATKEKRRNELAQELGCDYPFAPFNPRSPLAQAIDRIIKLEDARK